MSVMSPELEVSTSKAPRRIDQSLAEAVFSFHNELFVPIREWCAARADRVTECYIIMRHGEFVYYVLGREQRFDFALMREISELTLELLDRDWPIEGNLLPESSADELTAFVDPREVFLHFRV